MSRRVRTSELRGWLRALRRECPPALPVVVRRCQLRGAFGDCVLARDHEFPHFQIRLAQGLDRAQMRDTLQHEWAHALAWAADEDEHGPAFGVAFARCYRATLGRSPVG